MSIGHIQEKIKEILRKCEKREIYTSFVVILVGTSSFFLGKIAAIEEKRPPVLIEEINMPNEPEQAMISEKNAESVGKYVASRTGKKYHLPSCVGAKSITEANRIWFDTKEEAENAGYAPAANCDGI